MPQDPRSDIVIRSRLTPSGTEFIVMCGVSSRLLAGPFAAMPDALGCAVARAGGANGRVLYEAHDERGRSIGDRLVLRTTCPE